MPIEFSHNVEDVDVRKDLCMKDTVPSAAAWEELTPPPQKWPPVAAPTPKEERAVYPDAGSELFHGAKKT
jgi:hypothetical protein